MPCASDAERQLGPRLDTGHARHRTMACRAAPESPVSTPDLRRVMDKAKLLIWITTSQEKRRTCQMMKVLAALALVVALTLPVPADALPASCLPTPLPATPIGPTFAIDLLFGEDNTLATI